MKRHRHIGLLIALLLTTPLGCRLAQTFKVEHVPTPTAEIMAVRLAEQTDEGARVEVTVELVNRCEVALPLVNAGYTVKVGDMPRVTYTSRPNRTLPAGGRQTVVLAAAFATGGGAVRTGMPVAVSGSIVYEPPGEIRMLLTESKVPLPSTSLRYHGILE